MHDFPTRRPFFLASIPDLAFPSHCPLQGIADFRAGDTLCESHRPSPPWHQLNLTAWGGKDPSTRCSSSANQRPLRTSDRARSLSSSGGSPLRDGVVDVSGFLREYRKGDIQAEEAAVLVSMDPDGGPSRLMHSPQFTPRRLDELRGICGSRSCPRHGKRHFKGMANEVLVYISLFFKEHETNVRGEDPVRIHLSLVPTGPSLTVHCPAGCWPSPQLPFAGAASPRTERTRAWTQLPPRP